MYLSIDLTNFKCLSYTEQPIPWRDRAVSFMKRVSNRFYRELAVDKWYLSDKRIAGLRKVAIKNKEVF